MMWRNHGLVRSLSLCCLLCFLWPQALRPDVVLTDAEAAEIRSILQDTRRKALSLRISLEASKEQSGALRNRLATVERSLEETALRLERSEIDLVQSLRSLDEVRRSLEILKADYLALNRSLTKQKRAAAVWRGIALISLGVLAADAALDIWRKWWEPKL